MILVYAKHPINCHNLFDSCINVRGQFSEFLNHKMVKCPLSNTPRQRCKTQQTNKMMPVITHLPKSNNGCFHNPFFYRLILANTSFPSVQSPLVNCLFTFFLSFPGLPLLCFHLFTMAAMVCSHPPKQFLFSFQIKENYFC